MTSPDRPRTVLILGAGQAGGELAFALRQNGFTDRILIAGDEPFAPYQRPPLSKAYLAGKVDLTALYIKPREAYDKANIELRTAVSAEHVDRTRKIVTFSDGSEQGYDKLVFATGGRPRPLQATGLEHSAKLGNLHYLRTIADVDKIHRQFQPGFRMVLIGGGYVGLEVAAAARQHGMHVTVLEAMSRVLARVTVPEISAFYERVHREAGVEIRTGAVVSSVVTDESGDAVTAIRCTDGSTTPADVVIVGIGLLPNTELAERSGLEVKDGIVVDELTRTADPDVLAIGDCTRHPNVMYGRNVRLESVPNALEQARTAAATLCGQHRPHHAVPWFWSDQYDLKLQMVGLAEGHDRLVLRGSTSTRSFSAFYMQAGRVISADAVNRPQDFMIAKRLVAQQVLVDPSQLADESLPLKALLGTPSP
jgi:3-phenylpropionate/trans-cinnamate dioxygenase ferredoxin reductase component